MPWVTLRSYRDAIDAELALARLAEAGIPATLADRNLAAIHWLWSHAIGGVKLRVEAAQLEAARALLAEDRSGDLAALPGASGEPAAGDRCPACGSDALATSKLQRNAGALSLFTGLPFVAWRRRWICSDCGHVWKPEPVAREPVAAETLAADERVREHRPYPVLRPLMAAGLGAAILYYVYLQL